jgi:hypothetical protein
MAPRLPRMYWGEIIYATPGSGKTYVAGKYNDVWDADELIVEAIAELSYFDCSRNRWGDTDKRTIIGAYFYHIHFNRRQMNRVYECAFEKMQEKCRNDDVVLLGTKDLMHRADRVFIQENDDIVRRSFNSEKEQDEVQSLPYNVSVHYINEYLDNSLQRACNN